MNGVNEELSTIDNYGLYVLKSLWQNLQMDASNWIVSAQNGHFLVEDACDVPCGVGFETSITGPTN